MMAEGGAGHDPECTEQRVSGQRLAGGGLHRLDLSAGSGSGDAEPGRSVEHTHTGTAIGLTIPSYAGFTGFFLAAASFLALAHTLREGDHIRVTLLLGNFSRPARRLLELWCVSSAGCLTAYFTWYTALLVWESYSYHDLSTGMVAVPIWIPQASMLLGLLVLVVALVDDLVRIISGKTPSYEEKGEIQPRKNRQDLLAEDAAK